MTEEQRYQALANEKQTAINNSNKTYEDLLNQNTQYSNSVNDYLNKYQTTQNEVYDKQTQFQVDLQNQNKEKAERDYQKEAIASKNAYYDFINPYGVQREIQAQNGLQNTGYNETTKSQAWTTQQNRTAQARASMNEAKLQFDNAIKEAYLNNDVNKANLALQILEQQQQEALRSFNYVSDTKQNQLSNNQSLDSDYNNRYNTLYSQIQQEKATKEAIRQWEAEMAYKQEQAKIAQQQWEKEYALSRNNYYGSSSGRSGSGSSSGGGVALTDSGSQRIQTNYYSGNVNPDVQYGTFGTLDKNGVKYQPDNVGGEKLSSSGKVVSDYFGKGNVTGASGANMDNQRVWKTKAGKYYIWDGSQNKYVDITGRIPNTSTGTVLSKVVRW